MSLIVSIRGVEERSLAVFACLGQFGGFGEEYEARVVRGCSWFVSVVGGLVRWFVSVPTVRLSGGEETVLLRLSLGIKRVFLVRDSQQQ